MYEDDHKRDECFFGGIGGGWVCFLKKEHLGIFLTLYSIITPFDTFENFHVFENIMEANAPFSIILSKVFKTLPKIFLNFFNVV